MRFQTLFRASICTAMMLGGMATAMADDPVPLPCDPSTCHPVPNPLPGCPSCPSTPAPDPGTAPGGPIDPHRV